MFGKGGEVAGTSPSPSGGHACDKVVLVDVQMTRQDMGGDDPLEHGPAGTVVPSPSSNICRQCFICFALLLFLVFFGWFSGLHLAVLLLLLLFEPKNLRIATGSSSFSRPNHEDNANVDKEDDPDPSRRVELPISFGGDPSSGEVQEGMLELEKKTKGVRAARIGLALHLLSYWVATAVFASGGWWCRSAGRYAECDPIGKKLAMTRECLWARQPGDYQAIYVMHYVALAYLVAHWVLDGAMMLSWGRAAARDPSEMPLLFSTYPMWSSAYWAVLFSATTLVTLTWTGPFVNWSTASGLWPLAITLLLEIIGVGALFSLLLRAKSNIRVFR